MLEGIQKGDTTMTFEENSTNKNALSEIKKRVKERVFGQDEAVEKICSLIDIAKRRYEIISNNNLRENSLPAFCSALLIGTSGSGKTYMMKNIAEEEGMIFWPVDATTITATGWRGGSMNTEWKMLSAKMKEDENEGKMALVFIDEADKIMREGVDRYDAGQAKWDMLKPLEGGNAKIQDDKDVFTIDFDRCCVVFAGAFTGIEKNRKVESTIGFSSPVQSTKNERGEVTREDLCEWGAPKELVGRLSLVMNLNELGEDDYKRILHEQILKKFSILAPNFRLDVDDTAVAALTDEALEQQLGARCINQRVNDIFTSQVWPKVTAMNGKGCVAKISFKNGKFTSSCKSSNKVADALTNAPQTAAKPSRGCAKFIRNTMRRSSSIWDCNPRVFLFNDVFEYLKILEQDAKNLTWEEGGQTINVRYSDAEIDLLYCIICCLKYYCDIEEYCTHGIKQLLGMSKINCKQQSSLENSLSNMDDKHRNDRAIDAWITEEGVQKLAMDREMCCEQGANSCEADAAEQAIQGIPEDEFARDVFEEYVQLPQEERDEAIKTACWRLM